MLGGVTHAQPGEKLATHRHHRENTGSILAGIKRAEGRYKDGGEEEAK